MTNDNLKHWFRDYGAYWIAYLLTIVLQAVITESQLPEPTVTWFFIFLGGFFVINILVAFLILLLTWPARRNLAFSRYIKILIAFSAVYVLSQLIAAAVVYFQG
ncbi:MAG TPA: hypothetical protein PK325_10465 [Cyclobacteriaceae bacterium]|nr:hypothetical protein [Cyclobacteriaceae bacterium]HMV10640.1 hypothetical protein [Cyclobacteriaceae bacterium]HMV91150.1 hypothetical protein [Cyclobacteriaceae bacterium]HMX02501.1 hypothetical protein [Cyclobacteriaceae bacterium]HMX52069.1 hypothetical protein [Cyclobacteriaceae bacterium]